MEDQDFKHLDQNILLEEAEWETTIVLRASKGATKIIMNDASHPCKGIKREEGETPALMQKKMMRMIEDLCMLYQEADQRKLLHNQELK